MYRPVGWRCGFFKNAWFERFTRKQRIADAALIDAVRRAERGQIDADLGGGVIKQRVARAGQGKSGGYRTIILFRLEQRAFFVFGFAKSEQANIEDGEEALFKKMAKELLALSDAQMAVLIGKGRFSEVEDGEEV
ncbi:type II toxin-antitoxin system RelE/ParE family toxin [Sinorhizobium meliloti]|nr:type II toxin-antitoxin system RelE/ParE family toxin [Sinorhizobium meliloti]WKL42341.1 type II toxin-antitoxin system RelE/ParE family toxin [Sinorhizobium meliloti]